MKKIFSFPAVTLMSKILTYPLHSTMNFCNDGQEFRDTFAEGKDYQKVILNNKEIKIDNKPVYFKNYREAGTTYTHDVLFDWDINVAFTHLSNKMHKTNFLQLAGLRHSIPSLLRFANVPLSTL